MDVIIPYGINYKKCSNISFSGYKKTQIFPFLEKNLIDKKSEIVFALVAELHVSSFYTDLENFIIEYFSNYLTLSSLTYSIFICKYFQKINSIKQTIPKGQQNIALINSNEIRNIFCSIFSNFIDSKIHKYVVKIEPKCFMDEVFLLHSNITSYHTVYDENNIALSDKLSRGIREILYWIDNPVLSHGNIEKILYWIHWCSKIESLEKKFYKNITFIFSSEYQILDKIKNKSCWEYFVWTKIWQASDKNHFLNKNLLKSLTKLFFHHYSHSKLKNRAGILALAVLICNYQNKIKVERTISKMEIFTSINANQFYKNINIDEDNDEKYLEEYNKFNNIKSKDNIKNIYKINTIEKKMDFLREYIPQNNPIPQNNSETQNIKKVSDYFST